LDHEAVFSVGPRATVQPWAEVVGIALAALALRPTHLRCDELPLAFAVVFDELPEQQILVRGE
jgi:hypothetical protein